MKRVNPVNGATECLPGEHDYQVSPIEGEPGHRAKTCARCGKFYGRVLGEASA